MMKVLSMLLCIFFSFISQAQSHDAELILHKKDIEIVNGKLLKKIYYEIKINNRAGEKYTKIFIPYSNLYKISKIDAYIKDPKGKVVKKLKKNEIIERSSISSYSFYEDDFVKEFTLKHNEYPYTIVYSYESQQNDFLYVDYWMPLLSYKIPTQEAELNLTIPLQFEISYLNQQLDPPSIDTIEKTVQYHWKTNYMDIVNKETFAPDIYNFVPTLEIVPKEFHFDIDGSFQNWNSYGSWESKILKGLDILPETEKKKIDFLIKDIDDDWGKIRKLYHYLQDETRYINVTIETGGLKPYPANYVSKNKYGDCKALSNYFMAVLKYIGFKSYYTNIHAGDPIKEINLDFPSQQFNHIILFVPLENQNIWLDCTSNKALGYVGTFIQNRNSFIIEDSKSRFIKTPALPPSDVKETRKIDIVYRNTIAHINSQNKYKGEMYELTFDLDKEYNQTEKSRFIKNYFIEDGFELQDYKLTKPHRDSTWFGLSYNATASNIYKHYGNDILASNIGFAIPILEKPVDRELPVQIDYPIYKTDTITYEKPIGYNSQLNKKNHKISNKYGTYKFDVILDEKKVVVTKSLLINSGSYPISEYEDFYNFWQEIVENEQKTNISFYK